MPLVKGSEIVPGDSVLGQSDGPSYQPAVCRPPEVCIMAEMRKNYCDGNNSASPKQAYT